MVYVMPDSNGLMCYRDGRSRVKFFATLYSNIACTNVRVISIFFNARLSSRLGLYHYWIHGKCISEMDKSWRNIGEKDK